MSPTMLLEMTKLKHKGTKIEGLENMPWSQLDKFLAEVNTKLSSNVPALYETPVFALLEESEKL